VLDGGDSSTSSGVTLDPDGGIILNSGSQQFYYMWIANNDHGWVSKYDTRTAKEVARYWSVIPKDCANSTGPPCTAGNLQPQLVSCPGGMTPPACATDLGQSNPSRTAIDLYGDVWIANRAVGTAGSVTKIANDISSCIDRNGDGKITTSHDIDGDGKIDPTVCTGTCPGATCDCEMVMPPPGSKLDPLAYDECVLFSTPIGTNGDGDIAGRGIAISRGAIEGGAGDVWVANHHEQKVYKLNNLNGQIVPADTMGHMSLDLSIKPYGLIVDSQQRLWVVKVPSAPVEMDLIDTTTGAFIAQDIKGPANCGSYALGIDGKDRFWVPGWSTNTSSACRYDRATDTWTHFDFTGTMCNGGHVYGRPRGIAVDDMGRVYMDVDTDLTGNGMSQVIRFDAETGTLIPFGTANCIDATDSLTSGGIGIALDGDGHPWVNNNSGNAMKVDKDTGAITRTAQQPSGLYTYSDFTGYELRKFTAPRGTYQKDFTGCSMDTRWRRIAWTADTPPGTTVQVFIKVGNTVADLNNTATMQYGPFTMSPADLDAAGVPHGLMARVTFVLLSMNGMSTPVLTGFDVYWLCSVSPG
jgi:hypothetical protein